MTNNIASIIGSLTTLRALLTQHSAWFKEQGLDPAVEEQRLAALHGQLLESLNAAAASISDSQAALDASWRTLSALPPGPATALLSLLASSELQGFGLRPDCQPSEPGCISGRPVPSPIPPTKFGGGAPKTLFP